MSKEFILWCDFCKNLDNPESKCYDCGQEYNLKPTNFEEKASVTAYRKAMELKGVDKNE